MDAPPIVVFDGVCRFCSRWVRRLIRWDRRATFRFAPMQSETGRRLMAEFGLDADDVDTFLLVDAGSAFTRSDAVLRVARRLPGLRAAAWLGRYIPRRLRDRLYDVVARHRYAWFGRSESCMVPGAEIRSRFLE